MWATRPRRSRPTGGAANRRTWSATRYSARAAFYRVSDRKQLWPSWPKAPSPGEMEQVQLRQDPLLLIDRSPLVGLVGVGQSQSGDGVTIICVVIELREGGGRGLLRTLAPTGGLHGPRPEGAAPVDPVPRLEDDRGTAYTVTMPSWTSGDCSADMLFRFAPAPPAAARRLVVRVPRTPPYALPAAGPNDGSWVFEVALDTNQRKRSTGTVTGGRRGAVP